MPVSNLLVAALGLGAVGVAVVATRKKPTKKKVLLRIPVTRRTPSSKTDHPICEKYPGGYWHPTAGYLGGTGGWSDEDLTMALAAVKEEVAEAPPWEDLSDARQISFELVRKIVHRWCPTLEMPEAPYKVSGYLNKSVALYYLWTTLENMVWNKLVA